MMTQSLVAMAAAVVVVVADEDGGFVVDPNHFAAGSLAGTRFMTDRVGDKPTGHVKLIGSDDGVSFWSLDGMRTGASITVDFSPKGGPSGLTGQWADGSIKWEDGNQWTFEATPPFEVKDANKGVLDVGGLYKDPNHFSAASPSFAGTRMISDEQGDAPGDKIFIIGSDDGAAFWSLCGRYTDKTTGALVVDFSPKGGPAGLHGQYNGTAIVWSDGNAWPRGTV